MLRSSLVALQESRAKFARDVEYLRETALDDAIDERTDAAESTVVAESVDELTEALEMVDSMPVDMDYIIG